MPQIFSNNATSTLSATLAAADTAVFIQPGHGARFPTIVAPDFAACTLEDASGNIEIVKVTAHAAAATTMTVVRAQQGTTALDWASGDLFELRHTALEATAWEATSAEVLAARQSQASLLANLQRFVNTFAAMTGNVDVGGHLFKNAADAVDPQDYVTLQQLLNASFAGTLPGQPGNAGKLLRTNGASASWGDAWGPATLISSNTTLTARTVYHFDSSAGPFDATLPLLPADDDWIWCVDRAGACYTNNVTVKGNGNDIRLDPSDLIVDVDFDSFLLVYNSTTGWVEQ